MQWIHDNVQELQAITGLAIALLTLVLIGITAFYATANWRTMRLLDADVRFKLKPIPHVGVVTASVWNSVRCDHAPMVLIAVSLRFVFENAKQMEHFHSFDHETIHDHGNASQYTLHIDMPAPAQSWILDLYYRDLIGLLDYGTVFDKNGFVAELNTVNRHTAWNRIRFWRGSRALKKRLGMN